MPKYKLENIEIPDSLNLNHEIHQQLISCIGKAFELLLLREGISAYGLSSDLHKFSTVGMAVKIDDSKENKVILHDNVGITYTFNLAKGGKE